MIKSFINLLCTIYHAPWLAVFIVLSSTDCNFEVRVMLTLIYTVHSFKFNLKLVQLLFFETFGTICH